MDAARFDAACGDFRRGLETAPHEPSLLLGLASACEELGDVVSARDALQRLLASHPANADAICLLGCLNERTGNVSGAVRLYDQALGLRPRHAAALANRRRLADERRAASSGVVRPAQTRHHDVEGAGRVD